jgi:hypothetical protein
MATDEEYMNFLERANEDPMKGYAKTENKTENKTGGKFKTADEGEEVPTVIRKAIENKFFVSDADEPFVPVVLNWDECGKALPDEGTFYSFLGRLVLGPRQVLLLTRLWACF